MPISTIGSNSLNQTSDLTINGLTVGKGGGAVSSNTAIGVSALSSNSAGTRNTVVGSTAGSGITGSRNTVLGDNILAGSTSGNDNVAVGDFTMRAHTGSSSTAVGAQAMANGTSNSGNNNTAIGQGALNANASGANNTAVGASSLTSNTTGSGNIAIGYQALYSNTTPGNNIAIGYQAVANGNGGNVTAVGYQAGLGSTCDNAAYFGYQAGYNATGGNGAVAIGAKINFGSASPINEVVLGVNAGGTVVGKGNSSFFVQAGGGGYYNGANQTSWNTTSDRRIKKNIVDNTDGLNKITSIRVRNFEYRLPEEIDEVPPEQGVQKLGVQLGVIAQELQEVLPECITEMSTGVLTVQNDNLTWYMVNAIKDLKTIVDAQAAEIAELKAKVA